MPIPGNEEPGAFSGQQQVQHQPVNFSCAVPIKKRRFPIIQPSSPPQEEKPSIFEDHDSKNKQDNNIPDEGLSLSDAKNTASPGDSDVSRTSTVTVKKEVTPTNIQTGQANVDISASKTLEAKPSTSLGPLDDLGNKKDVLQKEKSSEPEVLESHMAAQTANVKQEIVSGQSEGAHRLELSSGKMNVELSLGPKEQLVPALEHHSSEAISCKSDKLNSSLLSLALHEERLVLHDKNGSSTDNDSNRLCANRSNWDLNTTMDVWEGRTSSDAFAQRLIDLGGFSKTNNQDDKSSLTTDGTVGLSLNKGKRILDGHTSNFPNVSIQPSQQCKNDDSLRLMLAMTYMDTSRERSSLSGNLVSTSISPNLNLKQVQPSIMKVNRTVKSEPVDDNSKRDCSVGSCSSSNMELLKFSSVKRESANNHSQETVLPSSIGLENLVDGRSMKSEVFQERNEESSKSGDAAIPQSVGRLMQHQESSASSSALPVPLMHQTPCPSKLPTCSEITTSGDLSNQSEQSFHTKELHHNDIPDESIALMVSKPVSQANNQLSPCKVENLSVVDPDKLELAQIDEHTHELCQYGGVAANDEEKINISAEMLKEDASGADSESQQNCAVDTICDKEDEEYEDGEVREPIKHSAAEDLIVEGKKTENLELIESDSQNLQPFVPLADQSINTSDFEGKDPGENNQEEAHGHPNRVCIGICHEPKSDDSSSQKLSDNVLEAVVDEKRSIVTPNKQPDLLGKGFQDSLGKEVFRDVPINGSHGIDVELRVEADDKVVKEKCPGEHDSTLAKAEASSDGPDAVKDSSNVGNKSRIINLSRASVATTPYKSKSIPNRLLPSRNGKERYSDLDGEMHPRGNRDEFYGGSNKFVKDRVHDQSLRNSRSNFMLGKGRVSGRFRSLRGEWDPDQDFASETSYGQSDYRVVRRKHASISDVELECNGYGVPQDGAALGSNRRKMINDEFPSVRRTSLRRLSSGDRDGPGTRGIQMIHRIPRNMSPRRCSTDAGSDVIGLRHDDKFLRHLSDDIVDPVYSRPQTIYDELDGPLVRGTRNFSTLQRKGYPRIRSKSPVRSRTRSPGPWSSPRRRSPNGLPELNEHRSPALYRMGRMRSPDRACFRDEMVARRHGSPSYIARHTNDLRDVDSGREHVHPRSADSNRRSSPGRVFPRGARRADVLDSREMGDGDEYMNGPLPSNKFHELRGDGSIDERRKFIDRRGPLRSFRQTYTSDNDNYRFHLNDGPRPYRYCPDADPDFVERSNMREREFDGRIKHQPLVVSRRIRNIEEQQDGNYRPVERVWHDDGFSDARAKRRRF